MAIFRGPKSVLIQGEGEAKPIAFPIYDNDTREYVVDIPDEFADTYRPALVGEGMCEQTVDVSSVEDVHDEGDPSADDLGRDMNGDDQ